MIIGLEKQFNGYLRVAVLDRFYCTEYIELFTQCEFLISSQFSGELSLIYMDSLCGIWCPDILSEWFNSM